MESPTSPEEGQRRERNARLAYERYATVVSWRNFKGDPMPRFDALNPVQKVAWGMAANADIPLPSEAPPAPPEHRAAKFDHTGGAHE